MSSVIATVTIYACIICQCDKVFCTAFANCSTHFASDKLSLCRDLWASIRPLAGGRTGGRDGRGATGRLAHGRAGRRSWRTARQERWRMGVEDGRRNHDGGRISRAGRKYPYWNFHAVWTVFSLQLKSRLFVPPIRLSVLGRTYGTYLHYERSYSIIVFIFGDSEASRGSGLTCRPRVRSP